MILRDSFRKETLRGGLACTVILLILTIPAAADPTTSTQAEAVVKGWLSTGMTPLGTSMSREIGEVRTYSNDGTIIYYVVCLDPEGFVIVPGDDQIEPIVGFLPGGDYDPSTDNPLGTLVSSDMKARVTAVRAVKMQAPSESAAQEKWTTLLSIGSGNLKPSQKIELADDEIRVGPLVLSTWNQGAVDSTACYNYYTPPGAEGAVGNYPCGCVATAMAQVMRYHEFPADGVGTPPFEIAIDDVSENRSLRGGDGTGGAYDWDNMPYDPDAGALSDEQRRAIGAICHDAGVATEMSYKTNESATVLSAAVMTDTFGYSNAVLGANYDAQAGTWLSIGEGITNMVNAGLDAECPVMLGISSAIAAIGHGIVCDGYGYNLETLYHHLNMGWSGQEDGWYSLPTSENTLGPVNSVVYNMFTTGSAEVVSGRVTDSAGDSIANAAVSAEDDGGQTYQTTTNEKGIYALKLPSNATYTVSVTKTGYTFPDETVTTGSSEDNEEQSGNVWGIDFEPGEEFVVDTRPPTVSQFQVGAGDGYIDVEWICPEPIDDYDGILIAYGLNVFPTLKAGDGKPVIVNGLTAYDGNEETTAKVALTNGTTAFFAVWTYSGTQFSNPNHAVGTPAPGADGINEFESLTADDHGGGSDSCFITTATGGRLLSIEIEEEDE